MQFLRQWRNGKESACSNFTVDVDCNRSILDYRIIVLPYPMCLFPPYYRTTLRFRLWNDRRMAARSQHEDHYRTSISFDAPEISSYRSITCLQYTFSSGTGFCARRYRQISPMYWEAWNNIQWLIVDRSMDTYRTLVLDTILPEVTSWEFSSNNTTRATNECLNYSCPIKRLKSIPFYCVLKNVPWCVVPLLS